MFCENCGTKISEEDSFCTNCGHPLKKEQNVSDVEETKVETEVNSNVPVEEEVETETNYNNVEESNNVSNNYQEESVNVVSEPVKVAPVIEKEKVKSGSKGGALIAIIIAVILIVTAGCLYLFVFKDMFAGKPLTVIEKAVNNMINMDSFTISANIEAEAEEQEISAGLDFSVDIKNKKAKANVNASVSGVSVEIPAYADLSDSENGVVYFKLPEIISENSDWLKISLGAIDFDEIFKNEDTKVKIKDEYKDIDLVEEVTSDVTGTKKYKVNLNEENLKKIKEIDEDVDFDIENLKEVGLEDGFSFYIYVNTKDNYISKILFELADYYTSEEVEFQKLNMIIEIKDVNKVSNIDIPDAAKNAKEADLSDIGNLGGNDYDDDILDDDFDSDDDYVDDYAITDYGFKVKYNMPQNFSASSVNSDDFKIYRRDSDELRVVLSNYWDTVEDAFDDVESDKEYYEENNYKNVSMSEEKTLKVNGKEFKYVTLNYESYGIKYYTAVVCYELDSEYIYKVKYEKYDEELTEEELKLFLDITVTKK